LADAPGRKPAAAVPVRGLPERGRVLCRGFIESVTYAPASETAAFTAIVTDHDSPQPVRARTQALAAVDAVPPGSRRRSTPVAADRLRVIWLGRRRIPGVQAGLELRLEGMVTVRDGLPTMFNPRYEILSRQEEQ
jgi:hypothetical protein